MFPAVLGFWDLFLLRILCFDTMSGSRDASSDRSSHASPRGDAGSSSMPMGGMHIRMGPNGVTVDRAPGLPVDLNAANPILAAVFAVLNRSDAERGMMRDGMNSEHGMNGGKNGEKGSSMNKGYPKGSVDAKGQGKGKGSNEREVSPEPKARSAPKRMPAKSKSKSTKGKKKY